MEISYKKDGMNNYMIIRNQKDVENDYKLQMLINNKIEGILSINIKKINNENQFYYDITSKNSMRSLFVKNKVGAKDIEQFINSMAIVAKSMKEYLLDINNIVFDMDMIYWDSKKKVYNFCYYPLTEQGMKEGLNGLFLELLELLNHNDREAVVIGYGLQQKIISENFTITELKEYVAENIKMPGNNINKYSYEKAKKSNYYNEKQNDDLEDLDNIIEEDADEYFDSTDFENDNINKRFSGYPEKVEIKEEKGYRIADIQAVSGTILLDQKKSNRVFQKKVQTYMGIASTVTADTEHSACILPGSDMRTGGTLIQYQETDWRFLKRMASQLGLPLVPDTSYYYPRFCLGLPEGEKRELGEIISCDLCFDGRYYAVSGKCLVDREDFICYDVVTRTSLSLGDRVTYEGRELLVSRKKTELAGGEVIFTYRLAGNGYTWVPWEDNPDYTGMSFVGSIVGTQGEQVEVAFDIDKTAAGGNRYGFAPATGNLMYCMPQKGTKTSLYIGNGDEAQGIATGCIRTNGSTCEGTGSPEKKSFRSEHGKGMDLYPQRMGLDGGETGKITFEDETGTTIESNGGLVLMAKEGIRLESMTGIAMQGISASKYTGYPPYDDAPKEGEFDWEGFTRNLAIGLGVVAVCAIGAAISIATLGAGSILAGAFIGAGIGALSTTAMKAGEEISTGNVRSAKEALRDVGISAASGFITGAFGAKFPGAHRLVEGVVDTAVSAGERLAYAVFDDSMSWDEKWAYAFDPGQMVADFVTGVVIGEFLDGIMAATQNKLRSIFANYDVTMREALETRVVLLH